MIIAALCKDPGNPANGMRTGDDFIDGQMVVFKCNSGFDIFGSTILRCVEGKWNNPLPVCKGEYAQSLCN